MKLKVFSIPALGDETACDELNAFLARQRVRDLDKRFVEAGASSYWSIAVTYVEGEDAQRPSQRSAAKAKIDYRSVLNEAEFEVYSRLRALRKQWGERDGVPPYNVINNDQLAWLVQHRKSTRADLEGLAGFGPARMEKYGAELVEALARNVSKLVGLPSSAKDGPQPPAVAAKSTPKPAP